MDCTRAGRHAFWQIKLFTARPRESRRSSRSPMMPNPPVTIADRIAAVGGAATMALIVFAIGFAIHKAISKKSPNKRIQGRPIVWWVTVLMFLGSCFGAWMADNQRYYLYEVVGGMGGFGLLAGLLIGNVHGFVDLYRARTSTSETSKTTFDRILNSDEGHVANPYTPPRTL